MTASGEGVKFFAWKDTVITAIYGYPDAEPCPDDEWKPGAPSILIQHQQVSSNLKSKTHMGIGHW